MYFRCLATDILVVARRTQRFQGRFASNRLWNLVRRWFPAAFPWAGAAAEPTGSVQSRIGKPQGLGVRLRRGSKDDGQMRALGIESGADLRRQTLDFLQDRFGKSGAERFAHRQANHGERRRERFGFTKPQRRRATRRSDNCRSHRGVGCRSGNGRRDLGHRAPIRS